MGNLDHKILPTKEGVDKLRNILAANVGHEDLNVIWGPELTLTVDPDEDTDVKDIVKRMDEDGSVTYYKVSERNKKVVSGTEDREIINRAINLPEVLVDPATGTEYRIQSWAASASVDDFVHVNATLLPCPKKEPLEDTVDISELEDSTYTVVTPKSAAYEDGSGDCIVNAAKPGTVVGFGKTPMGVVLNKWEGTNE